MPTAITDAVVLRQFEWSETSQVAVLFTRDHGLIRGLAKGSRRLPSAFDGGLEPLSVGAIGVVIKPDRELLTLTEWGVTRYFPGFRRSATVYAAAVFCAECVMRGFGPQDPHADLFDLLVSTLGTLDAAADQPLVATLPPTAYLVAAVLKTAGVFPDVPPTVDGPAVYAFDPSAGRFSVPSSVEDARRGGLWLIRGETVSKLAGLGADSSERKTLDAETESWARCARFLIAWFAQVFGKELQSAAFMLDMATGVTGPSASSRRRD